MIKDGETCEVRNGARIDWIDALKGFLIFCVTAGHLNMWGPIEKYIYSFHMPCFFFLSGFLFSARRPAVETIKRARKRILMPFLVWNTMSCIVDLLLGGDPGEFIPSLFVINGELTWNASVWFLLVLFITEAIVVLLRLQKSPKISVISIAICVVLWVLIGDKSLTWKLNLVPMATAFFLFGSLFKPYISRIGNWRVLVPLWFGNLVFSMLNIRVMYTYGVFGNYIYCMVAAVCGVLFFVGLFSCIKRLSWIKFLVNWGKNSLLIMATQFYLFRLTEFVSTRFLKVNLMNYKSTALSLVLAVLVTVSINLAAVFYRKHTEENKFMRAVGEAFGIQYGTALCTHTTSE